MNTTSQVHFAWLNGYVFVVSIVQIFLVGYWWRARTHRLTLSVIAGAVITAVWGAALFVPFEHTVVVEMPHGSSAATTDAVASVISTAVVACLVVGINQLVLLGIRAGLNWKRA